MEAAPAALARWFSRVNTRAQVSDTVRVWHDGFHSMLEMMLREELHKHGVPQVDLAHAVRVSTFLIEGLLAHPTSGEDRRNLVRWLVSRLGKE